MGTEQQKEKYFYMIDMKYSGFLTNFTDFFKINLCLRQFFLVYMENNML